MLAGIPREARWVAAFCIALAAAARFYPQQGAAPDARSRIPLATPPGITLQLHANTVKTRVETAAEWIFADSHGMSLYTVDKDTTDASACTGACADAWPAALAPPAATPEGDWSPLARQDGTQQWVHDGAPLYGFRNDKAIGDVAGDGADGGAWRVAVFRPDAGMDLPDGIVVREVADAAGAGLVDSSGLTLYAFDGNAALSEPPCGGDECARLWIPLEAPAIANSVGKFSAIARDDGLMQWTYRGNPLYRFAADRQPGDVHGSGVDVRFRVALVLRYFMPTDALIRRTLELGDILSTRNGATLYQRDRVTAEELHPFRTDHGAPALGRWFGISTCDENCTTTWPPFTAPADALPSGYWDIATRPDGSRQWVYKGFALYTYAADKPGAIGGNGIYDLQQIGSDKHGDPAGAAIDPNGSIRAAVPGAGVGALFWHAVVP